mmetsp:Transcript_6374/g.8241  ORF Transcript_6374/g.8241 Transcript_6374/m.8241 type:complete len:172 (+) Transcript_6374:377-892(+)
MLEVEEKRGEGVCCSHHMAIGCARLGQPTQQIVAGTLAELLLVDFGEPLHSVVLCHSELHELERDFLEPMRAPQVTNEQSIEAARLALEQVAQLTRPEKESEDEDEESDFGPVVPTPVHTESNTESNVVVPPPPVGQAEEKLKHEMDDDDVMELFGVSPSDFSGTIEDDDE